MRIYTVDECREMVEMKSNYYSNGNKVLTFRPVDASGKRISVEVVLANMDRKMFQHDIIRVNNIVNYLSNVYPKLQDILPEVSIYMCPFPSIGFQNAEVWGKGDLIIYPRTTQIPSVMTNYLVPHEFGHIYQAFLCDVHNHMSLWREYLALRQAPRGICKRVWIDEGEGFYGDKEDFHCLHWGGENEANYPHDWDKKPVEWFAEDFRYFSGSDQRWELTTIARPTKEIIDFIYRL